MKPETAVTKILRAIDVEQFAKADRDVFDLIF
jgi:hypothetical protein